MYLGLFIVYSTLIVILCTSIFLQRKCPINLYIANRKINVSSIYGVFIPTFIVMGMGIIWAYARETTLASLINNPPISHALLNVPQFLLNIPLIYFLYKIRHLSGIFMFIFFIISIFYMAFRYLSEKEKNASFLSIVFLVYATILSIHSLESLHAVLYALPIIITFSGIFLVKKLSVVPSIKISIESKNIHINSQTVQLLFLICILCLFAIEPILQVFQVYPTFGFGIKFTDEETNLVNYIMSLQNDSVVLTDYRRNRLLNCYAINKTLLYTPFNTFIHFYAYFCWRISFICFSYRKFSVNQRFRCFFRTYYINRRP